MSDSVDPSPITAKCIARALLGHLRLRSTSSIVIPNVFVGNSPWESDAIKVMPSCFWTEYEIKVSVSDYRADFAKRRYRWSSTSLSKHDAYRSDGPIEIQSATGDRVVKTLPKPKQFYFVVPKGLLDGIDVPKHCGVMEFERTRGWGITTSRRAPSLPGHSKLDPQSIFSLAMKASYRIVIR